MKKIVVTGSNGLLGQKITERVLKLNDFELIATAKGPNRFPQTAGYVYQEMDICDVAQMQAVLKHYMPDAVIHTAAMTNVDVCESSQEEAYNLNVKATADLAKICTELDIQLVHLSTDFIFDGAEGPYTEEASPNPLSYYGKTKLWAEQAVQNNATKWTILRTIIVYGIVADMSRSNIILWAKGALEQGQKINVVNDQWRMPTLAEDLAEICLLAVQKEAQGVFNASGQDMMRIVDIVYAVADFWQLDKSLITEISAESLNQAAKRPIKTGFDLSKSRQDLGYQPHTFMQGLAIVDAQLKTSII
ncbi:MAG: SDR family oxidoreductase [Pedobacter sp.]|nr:MAG: SDR family oxidoreductase [Pedobacter sp.]